MITLQYSSPIRAFGSASWCVEEVCPTEVYDTEGRHLMRDILYRPCVTLQVTRQRRAFHIAAESGSALKKPEVATKETGPESAGQDASHSASSA